MVAYVVFTRERTRDAKEIELYKQKAPAASVGRPIKILALFGPHEVLEGPETEGMAILEFPTVAEAKAWYNSQSYREAREHRFKGADFRGIIVEGN